MNFKILPALLLAASWTAAADPARPLSIDTHFEGASLGQVDPISENHLRCHVAGQHDQHGHNRQATWYYFRIDGAKDRDITLTLTDLVGEYNNKPGACAMSPDIIPVFSFDNEHWQHFPSMDWDDKKKEATLRLHSQQPSLWIAHIPPYTTTHLDHFIEQLQSPFARVSVIGKSVEHRDLRLITITNERSPNHAKRVVWMITRQHAWEAGTSFVMEGAIRFLVSDAPEAEAIRNSTIFKFIPTMDPDGCASGKVRFNANGYDLNRHWTEIDLHHPQLQKQMPEIWAAKASIFDWLDSGHKIDFLLNMHNTESTEFLETQSDDPASLKTLDRLQDILQAQSSFDPSRRPDRSANPPDTTNSLWTERRIPAALMEQRIGFSKKLGRRPSVQDRLGFGRDLVKVLAKYYSDSGIEHSFITPGP